MSLTPDREQSKVRDQLKNNPLMTRGYLKVFGEDLLPNCSVVVLVFAIFLLILLLVSL